MTPMYIFLPFSSFLLFDNGYPINTAMMTLIAIPPKHLFIVIQKDSQKELRSKTYRYAERLKPIGMRPTSFAAAAVEDDSDTAKTLIRGAMQRNAAIDKIL